MTIARPLMLATIAITISACAAQNWVPGPSARTGDFGVVKAHCNFVARHGGSPFYAAGSQQFVTNAALGNAIGEVFRTAADFDDCMRMNGWRTAENLQVATATPAIAVTALPVPGQPARPEFTPEWSTFVEKAGDHPGKLVSICGRSDIGDWVCRYPVPKADE